MLQLFFQRIFFPYLINISFSLPIIVLIKNRFIFQLFHLPHQAHRKAVATMRTGIYTAVLYDIGAIAGGSRSLIGGKFLINPVDGTRSRHGQKHRPRRLQHTLPVGQRDVVALEITRRVIDIIQLITGGLPMVGQHLLLQPLYPE